MPTVRQLASGMIFALVSLLLVIGSLSLSRAQGRYAEVHTPTPTADAESTKTAVPTSQPTGTPSPESMDTPTATVSEAPPTSTYFFPSAAATVRHVTSTTRACGPYAGWVRGYVVQPGDTLYRIATLHGTTVSMLQRANCKSGTVIYAGELLWVPFMLPPPTELTIIPNFDTPTEPATPTATENTPEIADP